MTLVLCSTYKQNGSDKIPVCGPHDTTRIVIQAAVSSEIGKEDKNDIQRSSDLIAKVDTTQDYIFLVPNQQAALFSDQYKQNSGQKSSSSTTQKTKPITKAKKSQS